MTDAENEQKGDGSHDPSAANAKRPRKKRICSPRGLTINPKRDIPLLILVRDSTCISRPQIHALAPHIGLTEPPKNLNRRLRNLEAHGLIISSKPCAPFFGSVYAISHTGLLTLENNGQSLASVSSKTENLTVPGQNLHALMLNKIRIGFYGCDDLRPTAWHTDRVVKAINIIQKRFAKDYDAVFDFDNKIMKKRMKVAVEYERSRKGPDRYERIANLISGETQVDLVLYFVDSPHLALEMATRFRSEGPIVAALPVAEFCSDGNAYFAKAFVSGSETGPAYRCGFYDLLSFCRDIPNFHRPGFEYLWKMQVESGDFEPIS